MHDCLIAVMSGELYDLKIISEAFERKIKELRSEIKTKDKEVAHFETQVSPLPYISIYTVYKLKICILLYRVWRISPNIDSSADSHK